MKKSWLELVHPLVKIGGSGVWLIGAVVVTDPIGLLIAACGTTLFLVFARVTRRPLAALWCALGLLLLGGLHLILGGTVVQAVCSTARLYVFMGVSAALMLTTDPAELLRALRRLPLPSGVILGLSLMWRSVPFLKQELESIVLAARLEGKSVSLMKPVQFFRYVMVPLAFGMTSYADELTVALHIRGISLNHPVSRLGAKTPLNGADTIFTLTTVAFVGSALTTSIW